MCRGEKVVEAPSPVARRSLRLRSTIQTAALSTHTDAQRRCSQAALHLFAITIRHGMVETVTTAMPHLRPRRAHEHWKHTESGTHHAESSTNCAGSCCWTLLTCCIEQAGVLAPWTNSRQDQVAWLGGGRRVARAGLVPTAHLWRANEAED